MALDTFRQDLKIGFRVLVREKAFCALAVTVLALGICGVTTMFSVVNGVMLRGFSFPNADRLASANFIDPTSQTAFGVNGQVTSMDYEELLPVQKSFEKMAAFLNGSTVNMTIDGTARRYTGAYVTEEFLRVLGISPMMGRDFTAADNARGAEKVALVGYGFWQRDFGGAANVVGRPVRINGQAATIIGVMPKGFAFPGNEEVWIPLYSEFPPKLRNDPTSISPSVIGVLEPGVTFDTANVEFSTLAARFASAYPETNKQFNAGRVEPLIKTFTPVQLRGTLLTMLAFCVGVLLIACVNVMNMQFARATLRSKELAIRSSLGANRLRLVRQMLTETLLLASIGAAVGIALGYGATGWLEATVRNLDNPPPSWISFDVDVFVLAVTVGAAVLAAVVSGLLPAWMSSRAGANGVLRDGGRGTTSRGMAVVSRALVVFQLVVTCVLLIGSLLQVRSILNQQTIDYGYDTAGVMSARMGLMAGDYPTAESRKVFYDRLAADLAQEPAFQSVGLTNRFRMVFSGNTPIEIDGRQYRDRNDRPNVSFEQATAGYFDALGQKILSGRTFADDDLDSRLPVGIVNEAFARKHFAAENPIGRRFRTANPNGTTFGPWRTIVGVVSSVRMLGPFNNPAVDETGFYVPFYASPVGPLPPSLVISQFTTIVARPRPGQSVDALANALRSAVRRTDANLPLYFVGTPKSQLDGQVASQRVIATMFSIFGVVAVVLASVGIYGVMSFSVNQRRQEFGVRMALGANTRRILGMVLRQGGLQIGLGLALGLGLATAIATAGGAAIQSTLFGVSARDPMTYTLVALVVTSVSLFATFVPARRATRVDPLIALRAE